MRTWFGTVMLLTLAGCSRPPEAPDDLYDLCTYLYTHQADDDPAAVEAGLEALSAWIDASWDEDIAGYEVAPLDDAAIDDLGDHTVSGNVGVAYVYRTHHPVDVSVRAHLTADKTLVHAGTYTSYERVHDGDVECFLSGECERHRTTEDVEVSLPLGIGTTTHTVNDHVWAEADRGTAMVQRSWLDGPAEVTVDWLEIDEQYYLNLFLPDGDGAYQLQTTWMVNEQSFVPEAMFLNSVISSMEDLAVELEAWVDENP